MAVLSLALPASLRALDSRRSLRQYGLDTWDARDGLPAGSVNALSRTRDGYLWLGTDSGLVRFDGKEFVLFDQGNTEGLDADLVMALHGQDDGTLWIGGRGVGAVRHERGRFTRVSTDSSVVAFAEGPGGRVWWGAGEGRSSRLFSYENGKEADRSDVFGGIAGSIESLAWDPREATLWIAHSRGLARATGGRATFVGPGEGLGSSVISVLRVGRAGELLVGTHGSGLLLREGARWRRLTTRDGLPSNDVRSLCEDRDGNLWIGTSAGLVRLSAGRLGVLTTDEGLPNDGVNALFEDGEGSLWIGTAGGLARLKDGVFTSVTRHEGLPDDSTNVVIETRDGSLWIGTDSGLARLAGGRVTSFRKSDGLPHDRVMALAEDTRGGLFVATEAGLVRWDGQRFARDPATIALARAFPERLWAYGLLAHQGALWLAGPEVLRAALDGTDVASSRRREGGPLMANFLIADARGRLWCGTYDGLLLLPEGGRAETHAIYETKDRASRGVLYAAHADRDGSLWLATRDRGLAHYRDGRVTLFGVAEGLPTNRLFSVVEDDLGRLWMSSGRGVARVAKSDLAAIESGAASAAHVVSYGLSDGLKSDESRFFGAPAAWRLRDGRLVFATRRGVAVVDPRATSAEASPIAAVVRGVVADRRPLAQLHDPVLPSGTREVQIQYAAVGLWAPERIRFRFRLSGEDADWVEAGARRTAYYTGLAPGVHVFEVAASSADGSWSGGVARLRFTLEPRFRQTLAARALGVALLVGSVAGLFTLRVARLRVRARQLTRMVDARTEDLRREIAEHERTEARLSEERDRRLAAVERETVAEERTRIARELHDSLAQNFAGLSLQLQSVAADLPADSDAPRQSLEVARRMLGHCQKEARRAVWDLRSPVGEPRPLRESIAALVAPLAGSGPAIEIRVEPADATLRPLQKRDLLRVLEEALANALSHGQARAIRVTCTVHADEVALEILDDGRGFDPEAAAGVAGGHFGILGMQERARRLGGRLHVVSRPGAGTRVRLSFARGPA